MRDRFEWALEQARRHYGFYVVAYVVMPEHVHLLLSETERATLATAIQVMKQSVARRVGGRFWQERDYDFNVWTRKKREGKMHYIYMNPVRRGLVDRPEDCKWSSFLHVATGAPSVVEIESQWTARARERLGIVPVLKMSKTIPPKPNAGLTGHPQEYVRMRTRSPGHPPEGWGSHELSHSGREGQAQRWGAVMGWMGEMRGGLSTSTDPH